MKRRRNRLLRTAVMSLLWISMIMLSSRAATAQERAADSALNSQGASSIETLLLEPGTLISVDLDVKNWKPIRKNETIEGHLAIPAYVAQQIVIPKGATVRMTIQSVDRASDTSGTWKRIGRGIVRAFNPLDSRAAPAYNVKLKAAEIILPGGQRLPITVQVLRAGTSATIHPREAGNRKNSKANQENEPQNPREAHSRMLLRLEEEIARPAPMIFPGADTAEMAARTGKARAFLLNSLSAAQNREGDRFQAVLAEPVRFGGRMFEAGSIVEGRVLRSTPPRTLSRPGSLSLRIDRLASQEQTFAIDGVLNAVESEAHALPALDEEGMLRGRKPGLKSTLVDLGIAYTVGKAADDIAEAPVRAVGAAMSDAAVANAARYFGLGASAIFLVTRHGRDVRLPKYAEIEINFGRVNQATSSSALACELLGGRSRVR